MSLATFLFNAQPQSHQSQPTAPNAELLAMIESDINRAQQFLDRIENLREITFSDILCASHSLRLAQATLRIISGGGKQ